MPSRPHGIQDFDCHRKFLKHFYLTRKAADPAFSYPRFAKGLGIRSPNYLKLIIDGKRNLTVSNIHRFARSLDLLPSELEYFETLVLASQARLADERAFYAARLQRLKSAMTSRTTKLQAADVPDLSSFMPVWVCLGGVRESEAVARVHELTGLAPERIEPLLKSLLEGGLVSLRDGLYRLEQDYVLVQDRKARSLAQKKAIRDQLQESSLRLETEYEKSAKFFVHTFTIPAGRFEHFVERMQSFMQAITEEADREPVGQVVQLNIQFFPYRRELQGVRPPVRARSKS
jgi:uncharacterized protein (TIGR02147 family)